MAEAFQPVSLNVSFETVPWLLTEDAFRDCAPPTSKVASGAEGCPLCGKRDSARGETVEDPDASMETHQGSLWIEAADVIGPCRWP